MNDQRDGGPDKRLSPLIATLADEAHLWFVEVGSPPAPDTAKRFFDILSTEERERHGRFQFEKDRHLFLMSHALVRIVLSHYCDMRPNEWEFHAAPGGRPEISNEPAGPMGLRFNLTHTEGLAACIVTSRIDCGVDAESNRVIGDLERLAKRVLHPRELVTFLATPKSERLDRFLSFWTTKEACMKACGRGLSLAPESFALKLDDNGSEAFCLEAPEGLDWIIGRFRPTETHQVAVALQTGEPRRTVVRKLDASLQQVTDQYLASGNSSDVS